MVKQRDHKCPYCKEKSYAESWALEKHKKKCLQRIQAFERYKAKEQKVTKHGK